MALQHLDLAKNEMGEGGTVEIGQASRKRALYLQKRKELTNTKRALTKSPIPLEKSSLIPNEPY